MSTLEQRKEEDEKHIKTRSSSKGQPYIPSFEAHALRCMATGISEHQCRNQMLLDKDFMFEGNKVKQDAFEIPELDWFRRLRERVSTEAQLYAFIKVAGADEVLQYGFDEAAVRRKDKMNQWCLIKNDDGELEVVTFEAAGILVGGKADEVAAHVEKTWERGQAGLEVLREELGDRADELVPLVNRGINLSKLRSMVHGTVRKRHTSHDLCFFL